MQIRAQDYDITLLLRAANQYRNNLITQLDKMITTGGCTITAAKIQNLIDRATAEIETVENDLGLGGV